MTTPDQSVALLQKYMRPNEIQTCVMYNENGLCPYECACKNVPDQTACRQGYIVAGNQSASTTLYGQSPNMYLPYCVDPTNVPPNLSNDSKLSWSVGCLSGVTGPHRIFDPTIDVTQSCAKNISQ